jgi:uncharacterized protein (DUF433 family)
MLKTASSTGSRHIVRDNEIFMQEPSIAGTQVLVRDIVELWKSGVLPEEIPGQLFNLVSVA